MGSEKKQKNTDATQPNPPQKQKKGQKTRNAIKNNLADRLGISVKDLDNATIDRMRQLEQNSYTEKTTDNNIWD